MKIQKLDADVVSVDYTYSCKGEIVESGTASFVIWEDSEYSWMENVVLWTWKDAIFSWVISWESLFADLYDVDAVQIYPEVIMSEVLWLSEPSIWDIVNVSSVWNWVVTSIIENAQWYLEYLIDFNDPKTYSDIEYLIKITDIEKR